MAVVIVTQQIVIGFRHCIAAVRRARDSLATLHCFRVRNARHLLQSDQCRQRDRSSNGNTDERPHKARCCGLGVGKLFLQLLVVDSRRHALAQHRHASDRSFATHCSTHRQVLSSLVPELNVLTKPAQQQFGLVLRQFAVHECGYLRFYCIVHSFPPSYRTRFPIFFPIASRALKILDRTVPTGQSIVCAISS